MDWNKNVKSYLELCAEGIPEKDRPDYCDHCHRKIKLYRHGLFERTLITLEENYLLPIYRFYCPLEDCKKTTCILPDFMVKHQQVALEVQALILDQQDEGVSLADLCEDEKLPGGPYTEKTLWRWTKRWKAFTEQRSQDFVAWILMFVPSAPFPLGFHQPSLWKWLSRWWMEAREQVNSWGELSALQSLQRYARVIGGVVTLVNPTKGVHR